LDPVARARAADRGTLGTSRGHARPHGRLTIQRAGRGARRLEDLARAPRAELLPYSEQRRLGPRASGPRASGLSRSPEPRSNAVRLRRFLLGSLVLAALARPERSICCDRGWPKFSLELGGPFLSTLGREPGSRLAGCLLEPRRHPADVVQQ